MTSASVGQVMFEIDGEGPSILFVHGLGGTSNSFKCFWANFAAFGVFGRICRVLVDPNLRLAS